VNLGGWLFLNQGIGVPSWVHTFFFALNTDLYEKGSSLAFASRGNETIKDDGIGKRITSEPSVFLKDPHSISSKDGRYRAKISLKIAEKLPKTSAAMSELASTQSKDDARRREKGIDDYTDSLEKLVFALDCFAEEYHRNCLGRRMMRDDWRSFLPINRDSLAYTMALLRQIRHMRVHDGGVVTERSKRRYERMFRSGAQSGSKTLVNLPSALVAGRAIHIDYSRFAEARKCLFEFIGRVGLVQEDVEILEHPASVSDIIVSLQAQFVLDYPDFEVIVRIRDLEAVGIDVGRFGEPSKMPEFIVLLDEKRMIFPSSGISVPVALEHKMSKPHTNV
jgi:hypothetical protein